MAPVASASTGWRPALARAVDAADRLHDAVAGVTDDEAVVYQAVAHLRGCLHHAQGGQWVASSQRIAATARGLRGEIGELMDCAAVGHLAAVRDRWDELAATIDHLADAAALEPEPRPRRAR